MENQWVVVIQTHPPWYRTYVS